MKEIFPYRYYWFGTCIRYLQDASEGYSIHAQDSVLNNIDWFLSYLDEFGLVVTARASHKLREFRDGLNDSNKDAILTDDQASHLRSLMGAIRHTLDAELQGVKAYIISQKRIDVIRLMDDVQSLFAPDVFKNLPKVAQFDFSEAGKCLAFDRPTAAAFHLLRGTEDTLRHFYCSLVRQNRIRPPLMWGSMVDDLRKRPKTKKYETLHNNLDNIRLSFRNPTQHPEAIYDIHEVQDLWSLCVEVVNRMTKIAESSRTGADHVK